MTTLVFVAIVSSVVAGLLLVVRRVIGRPTASLHSNGFTVSRQWLIQHQSNDRP